MLQIHSLRAGRDFAKRHPLARTMANIVYAAVDPDTKEALLIDPSWNIAEVCDWVRAQGWLLQGAVATHAHFDHVGGACGASRIEGFFELAGACPDLPMWVHRNDAKSFSALTGLPLQRASLVSSSGELIPCGHRHLKILHTPGHTPGSMCLLADGAVLTGDTLFVGDCGRADLPGSDPMALWASLNQTLKALPDETRLFPGHDYGETSTSTVGQEKETNPNLRATLSEWCAAFGL